jgi:hypothetical protein
MAENLFKFDVRHDTRRIVAEIRAEQANITKATANAINRTADELRTQAGKIIRAEYNVTLRGIRQASKIRRASVRSKFPRAEVIFSGRRINLYEFAARQTKKGVTVKVKVSGGRKLIPGAFVQTLKSGQNIGKRGVFKRVGKERYPIHFLPSLSIPQMTERKALSVAILKFADARYDKNLRQQLKFVMGR